MSICRGKSQVYLFNAHAQAHVVRRSSFGHTFHEQASFVKQNFTEASHHLLSNFIWVVFLDVVIKLYCFVIFVLLFTLFWVNNSQPKLYNITRHIFCFVLRVCQFNFDTSVFKEEIMLQ